MKKNLSVILTLLIVFSTVPVFDTTVSAASVTYYETSYANVKLRNEIGEEKEVVSYIKEKGTAFKVVESKMHTTARIWHKVQVPSTLTTNGLGGTFWLWNGNVSKHKHDMKDSVCQTLGCDYYEPIKHVDNKIRHVKVKTSTSAIRLYPYLGGKELDRLAKGTPITTVGAVKNSKDNIWYIVSDNRGYVFSGNVEELSQSKVDNLSNNVNNGGGSSSSGGSSGGSGNTQYFSPTVSKPCDHEGTWSVGKCVNCGKNWALKEISVNETFVVNADNVSALDIPYREGSKMKTYSKGSKVFIVSKAENSAKHYWYKTSDGYWIYNVSKVSLKSVKFTKTSHTFKKLGDAFKPSITMEPSNAPIDKISWVSGREEIASVSTDGTITAKSPGKTVITCLVKDSNGISKGAELNVVVTEAAGLETWEYSNQKYEKKLALECAQYATLSYLDRDYTGKDTILMTKVSEKKNPEGLLRLLKDRKFKYYISTSYHYPSVTNSPYVLASKKVNYNGTVKDVVYVIVQGSATKEAWQGNMMMSDSSEKDLGYHYSFNAAKNLVRLDMDAYIKNNNIKNPFVVITGHSRAAAIGNMLAAEITNNANYDKVYAYLFATPNVTKTPNRSLTNIINICNTQDFVTYLPFSSNWGYGKNGVIYSFDSLAAYGSNSYFKELTNYHFGKAPDYNWCAGGPQDARSFIVGTWKSVAEYYKHNKNAYSSTKGACSDEAYDYFKNGLALAASGNITGINTLLSHIVQDPQNYRYNCPFTVLSAYFISNGAPVNKLSAFGDCHVMETYYPAILAGLSFRTDQVSLFTEPVYGNGSVPINQDEYEALNAFFNQGENQLMLEVAGWDIEDESTWEGIKWDTNGNVVSIDLSYLNLSGWFLADNFPKLQNLNIDGNDIAMLAVSDCSELVNLSCIANDISSLDVNECSNLQNLNCGFNQISSLDVSDMPQLSELNCYGNEITNLDLEGATSLQTLRCGDNELYTVDVSTNKSLSTFYCDNNNIVESQNKELMEQINKMNLNGGSATIGTQKYNENYAFNSSELSSLTEFANMSLNLEKLGWNMDDPYTWQGIEWKIYGDEYHITSIDFDGLDLEGDFILPEAEHLESVSCEDSSLATLNLSGCTNLQTLNCHNAGIMSLQIDDCSSLSEIKCDENYLEVENVESSLNQIGLNTGMASYETQNIALDEDLFNQTERDVLIEFLSSGVNSDILGWDWNFPGTWDGIVWTMSEGEYHVSKVNLGGMNVCGKLDLSAFEHLEEFDFSGTQIETVMLPNCITKIPEYAFYNSDIKYIHMSEGVTNVEKYAFAHCDNLNTVVLPKSITKILDNAFSESVNLKNLVFMGDEPLVWGNDVVSGTSEEFNVIFFEDSEWTGRTEIMNNYLYTFAKEDYIVLFDENIELKENDFYNETNNYAGDDINVTVISKNPGSEQSCLLSVYDELGRLTKLVSLPIKTTRYMNAISFEDIEIQYVGEEYCTIKAFLWSNLNNLKPLSATAEKVLIKPMGA